MALPSANTSPTSSEVMLALQLFLELEPEAQKLITDLIAKIHSKTIGGTSVQSSPTTQP